MPITLKPLLRTRAEDLALTKLANETLDTARTVKEMQAELERLQEGLPEAIGKAAAARNKLMGAFEMVCRRHRVDPDTMEWSIEGGVVSMTVPTSSAANGSS